MNYLDIINKRFRLQTYVLGFLTIGFIGFTLKYGYELYEY